MQTQIEKTNELLNRDEAANFLRLSPGTLANWQSTQRQKIPCVKLGGRIFYRATDLQKWIEQQVFNAIN
jgi:hypothetical protein